MQSHLFPIGHISTFIHYNSVKLGCVQLSNNFSLYSQGHTLQQFILYVMATISLVFSEATGLTMYVINLVGASIAAYINYKYQN